MESNSACKCGEHVETHAIEQYERYTIEAIEHCATS